MQIHDLTPTEASIYASNLLDTMGDESFNFVMYATRYHFAQLAIALYYQLVTGALPDEAGVVVRSVDMGTILDSSCVRVL